MRALSLFTLLLLGTVHAQYFSKGWAPGQQAEPSATPSVAGWDPSTAPPSTESPDEAPKQKGLSALFDLLDPLNIVQMGPFPAIFERFGINITENVAAARNRTFWDPRIPLITDDNFEELIVNEQLTFEELRDRVWAIVITATESNQESLSKFVDEAFDDAFNRTMLAGDMPNVKWGRIDYLNVTYLTTKWAVWRAPTILILQDRGLTLRFYQPTHIKLRDGAFRDFMLAEAWKISPPWVSDYAPGGDREWIMHNFALGMKVVYDRLAKVPKIILMVASGVLGSLILGLMHRPSKKPAPSDLPLKKVEATAPEMTEIATEKQPAARSGSSKGSFGKKKKGKK